MDKEEKFLVRAMENIHSFQKRLDQHFVLDHHDIGFLYSLSAGAGYKVVDSQLCKESFLQAANILVARFQNKGILSKLGEHTVILSNTV